MGTDTSYIEPGKKREIFAMPHDIRFSFLARLSFIANRRTCCVDISLPHGFPPYLPGLGQILDLVVAAVSIST